MAGPAFLATNAERVPVLQERKGTNVYVSNLPSSMTASRFRTIFGAFGTIIGARLVKRRKGDAPVGFVQFTVAEMAQAAITAMDGRIFDGAKVSARLANRDKDKGINNKPSSNLYVANLPQKVTELDLRVIFSRYGEIHSLRILKYPNTGVSKGTALVRFMTVEDATRAKDALHCLPLQGQDLPLEVKYAETKEEKVSRRDDRASDKAKVKGPGKDGGVAAPPQAFWDAEFAYYDQDEQEAAEDFLAGEGMEAFNGETEGESSPKLSPVQNEDALHALGDYMRFMLGAKGDETENISWVSQSSGIASSFGHSANSSSHSSFGFSPKPDTLLLGTAPLFLPQTPTNSSFGAPEATSGSDSIMVEGLPPPMNKLELYELFGPLGAILKMESVLDADSNTRTAIVKFKTPEEAATATIKLSGSQLGGFTLRAKMF